MSIKPQKTHQMIFQNSEDSLLWNDWFLPLKLGAVASEKKIEQYNMLKICINITQ